MMFFSPASLWFLLLIPILVLLYILKQRFEEREVSSLFLWQQLLADTEATSPFQKLKNNILFILQLLALLMLIFAMANPFLWWKKQDYQNIVIVMDTTGSMSALGESTIKLEEAKEKAESLIESLPSASKITLISAAKSCKVELSAVTDKKEVINRIKNLERTNSEGNIEDSYSLVKAICSQFESYKVTFFSDSAMDMKELNGELVIIPSNTENVSLDYIAHSKAENKLRVMLRVTNRGKEGTASEVCLYGDKKLLSLKEIELSAGETKTVYFEDIPSNVSFLNGELSKKDANMEDNVIYSIVKQENSGRILLSTDKNVFLEKVLLTMKNIDIYKAVPEESITSDFDLYIFDKTLPENLPAKGSILLINPGAKNSLTSIGEEKEGGKADILSHSITKYMENSNFVISKVREITVPYWGSPLLKVNNRNIAFVGELKGQKIGALGFDLHNTDMPLTPEFPIFINNIVSYLMDRDAFSNYQYLCGESIEINPLPEAEKIIITNPLNNKAEISSKYPVKPFDNTYLSGIYEISQAIGKDKENKELVAVNFPISESITADLKANDSIAERRTEASRGGINIKDILLLIAIGIIIIEWIVYIKINGIRRDRKSNGKGGGLWG